MLTQMLQRRRTQPQTGPSVVAANIREQGLDQDGQIVESLAQRRQCHRNDIEAIEQILAELALLDHLFEMAVGGADQSHVHSHFGGLAHGTHPPLLHGPQKLGLHRQRQLADLIEKQGAALRCGEETGMVGHRPGESAFAVAEKLGLEQLFGNGAAVHRNKRSAGASAAFVHGPGGQLLARARLTVNQHRRHAARHALQCLLERAHHRGIAHHALQRTAGRRAHVHIGRGNGRVHGAAQRRQIDRLAQIVERTCLERGHGIAGTAVGGDDNGFFVPVGLRFQPAQQLQALAIGKAHIGEHERVFPAGQVVARLGNTGRHVDLPSLVHQTQGVELAQIGLVVDDENAHIRWIHASGPGAI